MWVFSSPITDDCLPITEQTPHPTSPNICQDWERKSRVCSHSL